VVDQDSHNGAKQVLEAYAVTGRIRLFRQQARNRGLGRQLALENALGDYIIANVDTDDVYKPKLHSLIDAYHSHCEGLVLRVADEHNEGALTIVPRKLALALGGWKPLGRLEDKEFWCRAAQACKYRWARFPIYESINLHRGSLRRRLSVGLWRARTHQPVLRVRRGQKNEDPWKLEIGNLLLLPALLYGKLTPTDVTIPTDVRFAWPQNPKYYIELLS
jgi:Glycosyl transferase family 2